MRWTALCAGRGRRHGFPVRAGEGAGDSLREMGLLRTDMDIVLLPELDLQAVAGLPGIARAVRAAGRTTPLRVNGPSGIVPVVDGANLLVSAGDAVRLSVVSEGEDQGLAGRVVFDSGVVSIRMFGSPDVRGRVYRVDFDGKSLVLAGCRVDAETILSAVRGTMTAAGVLSAGSEVLAPNADACVDVDEVLEAAGQGRLAAALVIPDSAIPARDAWRELIAAQPQAKAGLGLAGAQIDLTADQPQMRE
ncbi:MAG: hypothetical protein R3C46_12465 [Hyphomonadaceae bacterium]